MKSKDLRRVVSVGLASIMLMPSATFAKEFKDVKKDNKYSWAYNAIDVLSDKNVISGHPDGNFKPGDNVSFEELMQLLKQILNPSSDELKTAREKYQKVAKDNGVNSWAEDAICLALHRGYLNESALKKASEMGFMKIENRSYPSRGDIAIFFARALNLDANGDKSLLKHKDVNKMGENLKGYLASLVDAKIFTSTGSDGSFEGDRPITRAETAIITKSSFDYASNNKVESKVEKKKGTVILSSKLNNVNVVIIESDKQKYSFDIDNNTKYKLKDKDIKLDDIKAGQEVEIEYVKSNNSDREGTAKTINVTNAMLDMVGYVNSKKDSGITLRYRDNSDTIDFRTTSKISTSDTKTFKLADNAKIKAYGKDLKLDDIKVDDLVEFKTDNDNKITEITVFPKEANISGKVVYLDTSNSNKASIKLRLKDNKDYEFYITKDSKDLDKITLNDEVNLYVNYKVAMGLASSYENDTQVMGEIQYFKKNDDEIGIRLSDRNIKYYRLAYDTKFYDREKSLQLSSQSSRDLEGKYAILEFNNYGEVETIRLVDKNSQFKAMLQVIDVRNSSGFRNIYSNEITLKVIQSDNKKLKIGETFIMSNAYTFDRYKVLTCDGYLDTNNNVSALFNIKEEGRAESELRDLYRINESGRFRTYDEVIKDNKGYNGRDNYYSRDINSFS